MLVLLANFIVVGGMRKKQVQVLAGFDDDDESAAHFCPLVLLSVAVAYCGGDDCCAIEEAR